VVTSISEEKKSLHVQDTSDIYHEDRGNMFLRNVGNHLKDVTDQKTTIQQREVLIKEVE
jgi:hypothetical protein